MMDSKPTVGLHRSNIMETKCLGLDLVAWDMGGQTKFRKEYFKQKYRVFSNTAVLFYVIDMQDNERFSEALEYMGNILETMDGLGETPRIIICFHKFDPDLRENAIFQQRRDVLKDQIQQLIPELETHFFETTIHELSTITKAFSEGTIKGSPKEKLISEFLKEYAKLTFSSAVVLTDENSLVIGSHYSNAKYLEICEIVAPRFISAMDRLNNYGVLPKNVIVNVSFKKDPKKDGTESENEDAMVFVQSFSTPGNMGFGVITLARNKRTFKLSEENLPQLANKLADLMHVMLE